MEFSERILKERKRHGLSQEALAYEIKVSRQTISKWESGSSYPDIDKIVLLSEVFDVTTDYLLKGTEERSRVLRKIEPWLLFTICTTIDVVAILFYFAMEMIVGIMPSIFLTVIIFIISLVIFHVGMYYADEKNKAKFRKYFWMVNIWIFAYFILYTVYFFYILNNMFGYIWTVPYIPVIESVLPVEAITEFGPHSKPYLDYLAAYDQYVKVTIAFYIIYFGTCITTIVLVNKDKIKGLLRHKNN